jgi:hypothetical protein
MNRSSAVQVGISLRHFVAGIWRRAYYWLPTLLLDPLDLYNNYIKADLPSVLRFEGRLPGEYFGPLLGVAVAWAGVMTYHELRMQHVANEQRLKCWLAFAYDDTDPDCAAISYSTAVGTGGQEQHRGFAVTLVNTSEALTLDDISIAVESIVKPDTRARVGHDYPKALGRREQNRLMEKEEPVPPFSLHPRDYVYVPVVSRWVGRLPGEQPERNLLQVAFVPWRFSRELPDGAYEATIVARGRNTAAARAVVSFHVDEQERLHFSIVSLVGGDAHATS